MRQLKAKDLRPGDKVVIKTVCSIGRVKESIHGLGAINGTKQMLDVHLIPDVGPFYGWDVTSVVEESDELEVVHRYRMSFWTWLKEFCRAR